MDADGNNKTFWNVGGDLEAVTIVDPNSNYIYVGIEHPDSIKEVDITTGKFTGKVWDLTQWLTGPDNSGLEALTFVPNGRHSHEASPSGGLFYAGLQADGKIYLFDIDLAHSGIVTFEDDVITPVSGRADISDMFYSNKTDTLYAIFDGANSLVEMAPDGAVLCDYALPLPNREQEGVVVVSPSPTLPAQIYIAQDAAPEVWKYDNFPVTHVVTLSISAGSGGTTGPAPGSYLYDWDTDATITANPAVGYEFSGWNGSLSGTENPATIVMDSDKSISASFSRITYTLSVSASNGSISLSPAGGIYNSGTVVTLTATPASGYKFDGWGGAVSGTANPISITMDVNKSVSANFSQIKYTLSITATNGSITLSPAGGTYPVGTVVTLTATPASGYKFDGCSWAVSGTTNPISITMDGNKSVSANFTLIPVNYTLTTTAKNGSVVLTPAGGTYASGTTVSLKAVPKNSWYRFTGWSGDLTGSANPATLIMNSNKKVTANFKFKLW